MLIGVTRPNKVDWFSVCCDSAWPGLDDHAKVAVLSAVGKVKPCPQLVLHTKYIYTKRNILNFYDF